MGSQVDDVGVASVTLQSGKRQLVFQKKHAAVAVQRRNASRLVDCTGQRAFGAMRSDEHALASARARAQTKRERAGRWCRRDLEPLDKIAVPVVERGKRQLVEATMRNNDQPLVA